MVNRSFPKRIALMRKERGLSQKQAAADLGISQALLSHYEKGVRECGLTFLVNIAEYYNVSCDYLLGRTRQRSLAKALPDDASNDTPTPMQAAKKQLLDTLNYLFEQLSLCSSRSIGSEAVLFVQLAVYRVLRLFSAASENGLFGYTQPNARAFADAAMTLSEAGLVSQCAELEAPLFPSNETALQQQAADTSNSVLALIETCEVRMGTKPRRPEPSLPRE